MKAVIAQDDVANCEGSQFEGRTFVSTAEYFGKWFVYYRSTRRNQYVYDLSYNLGNIHNNAYIDRAQDRAGYNIFDPVEADFSSEDGPDPEYEAYKSVMVEEEDTWEDIKTLLQMIVGIGENFQDNHQKNMLGNRVAHYRDFCSTHFPNTPQLRAIIGFINEELKKLRNSISGEK